MIKSIPHRAYVRSVSKDGEYEGPARQVASAKVVHGQIQLTFADDGPPPGTPLPEGKEFEFQGRIDDDPWIGTNTNPVTTLVQTLQIMKEGRENLFQILQQLFADSETDPDAFVTFL